MEKTYEVVNVEKVVATEAKELMLQLQHEHQNKNRSSNNKQTQESSNSTIDVAEQLPASITNDSKMNEQLQNDLLQLDNLLEKVKEQGLEYLNNISDRQTSTSTKNTINGKLNLSVNGLGTIDTLKQFNERFEPIIVSTSGPRFWGFVTGGSTPASIVGDWLTTIYDQNTFATKRTRRYFSNN